MSIVTKGEERSKRLAVTLTRYEKRQRTFPNPFFRRGKHGLDIGYTTGPQWYQRVSFKCENKTIPNSLGSDGCRRGNVRREQNNNTYCIPSFRRYSKLKRKRHRPRMSVGEIFHCRFKRNSVMFLFSCVLLCWQRTYIIRKYNAILSKNSSLYHHHYHSDN